MKKIQKLVDNIDEEICGAKHYAECYIELKAKNEMQWANRFKEMANSELEHANYLHQYALAEIEELEKVFTPPQEMQDAWDKAHKKYVERVAWVKQMLAM